MLHNNIKIRAGFIPLVIIFIVVGAALIIGGLYTWGRYRQAQSAPSSTITHEQNGAQFTNPSGGYSFDYPAVWKVAINQYNNNNSLFGPGADSASGLGGVEVFPNQTSINSFLGGVAAQYDNKISIAVDGIPAVRTHYKGTPVSGTEVVLLKDGKIYNIYVNSEKIEDISLFDQLVSTFQFVR